MTCPSGLVPSSNSRTVFDGRHDGATGDEGDSTTDRRLIRARRSMRPEEGTTSARMHGPATYRSEADSGVDFPWTSDHRWTTGYDTEHQQEPEVVKRPRRGPRVVAPADVPDEAPFRL